jgi:hypothetical protein
MIYGPNIVKSGLILALDASEKTSYIGTGTSWRDLSGQNAHASISGSVSFVNSGVASYFNFATAGAANYIGSTLAQNYLDVTIVFQPDFTLVSNANLAGLIGSSNDTTNSDKSMRFSNANGTGPWSIINPDNTDGWASSATTYYINGIAYTGAGNLVSGWNILGATRTNTSTGAFASPFAYFLGTEGFSGAVRDFQGKIAACYMYNRSLTNAEQLQNYRALRYRFGI